MTFSAKICPKMDIGLKIEGNNVGIRISILEIPCVPIFRQNGQLCLFCPNLPKNECWGRNFKNLCPDLELPTPRYRVHQSSVKKNNFGFFDLNLEKLPNYVQYFGSSNVADVTESWVVEEMSWVEMNGVGWRWVHGSVIP